MFKEHANTTSRWDWNELSFGLLGFVEAGRERLSKFSSIIDGYKVIESAHKNWDNTSYCRSLSQDAPRQYTYQQLMEVFPDNFRTFTDEYCLGTLVQEYPLSVQDEGTHGITNAYQETLSVQASRFQDKIAKTGKRQQRAQVETYNSQRLDRWLATICLDDTYPIGSKLVWCSPPGFKVEGYHGTSPQHHSFIWVYEKKLDGSGRAAMTMTQFRCWPSLAQMEAIQQQLRQQATQSPLIEQTQLDTIPLSRRNKVIANFIELPPSVSVEQIEEIIYGSEASWQVDRDDMPNISPENVTAFGEYRDVLLAQFLIPMYQVTLAPVHQLTDPYSSAFWQSAEYAAVINKLDLAFSIAWQHLLKYVDSIDERRFDRPPIPQLHHIPELRELFFIKLKSDDGKANKQDRQRFNILAPQLLSVGSRTLSVGQCGIGTLIPTQLFRGLENFSALRSAPSLSYLNQFDIAKLSAVDKLSFKNTVLSQYKPLTLIGRLGRTEKFWIRSEYYEQYLLGSKVLPTGEFVGPCDISLTSGLDEFVLTDAKYRELFQAASPFHLSSLAQLESDETMALSQAGSDVERQNIRDNYTQQRVKLKNTVSVTELVNNDLFRPTFARV